VIPASSVVEIFLYVVTSYFKVMLNQENVNKAETVKLNKAIKSKFVFPVTTLPHYLFS
jgi:hypothetical protein